MKTGLVCILVLSLACSTSAFSQDAGRHGGAQRGAGAIGVSLLNSGRAVIGTVTEAAPDHFTIDTYKGETYTVYLGLSTRYSKQVGAQEKAQQPEEGAPAGKRKGTSEIKASEIKEDSDIAALGDVNPGQKTVAAKAVILLDPAAAQRIKKALGEFGKTWMSGKVTAIEGTKITVESSVDHKSHHIVVNEQTSFQKRRDAITLADIKEGDMLRAEGSEKGNTFTAAKVNLVVPPPAGERKLHGKKAAAAEAPQK